MNRNERSYVGAMYRKRRVDGKADFRYYSSFGEVMAKGFEEDRDLMTIGPVQIRCLHHGWQIVGSRGMCPSCVVAGPDDKWAAAMAEAHERSEDLLTHLSA